MLFMVDDTNSITSFETFLSNLNKKISKTLWREIIKANYKLYLIYKFFVASVHVI